MASRLFKPLGPRPRLMGAVASFVAVVAAWWVAAAMGVAPAIFLPSPPKVVSTFFALVGTESFWKDMASSFRRISVGFLLSSALAIPVGVMIGVSSRAEAALEPVVSFVRYMPVVAFVPLTLVWVGIGESQKYVLIFLGTFFSQALMAADQVKRVPRELVNVGLTLGFSDGRILRRIVLPWSAPGLWDTLRVTLGWAWSWLLLAELVAAPDGLGHRIILGQRYLRTDDIFVVVIVIGVIGLLMDVSMKWAGRRLFRWQAGR